MTRAHLIAALTKLNVQAREDFYACPVDTREESEASDMWAATSHALDLAKRYDSATFHGLDIRR